jgi:pimeloyl-ACP methyl ester carboxylesterase
MSGAPTSPGDPQTKRADDPRAAELARRKEFWIGRFRRARTGLDRPGETAATPPEQPASGPGGREYAHLRVVGTLHGSDAAAYWLFEPAAPSPPSAPVVVFLHGWGGTDPLYCGAWIDHLTMRGNAVLFPVYQTSAKWDPDVVLGNSVRALQAAFRGLKGHEHPRCDWDRYAIVGHSVGGVLAVQLAAVAAKSRLPRPKAVMAVHPGRGDDRWPIPRVPLRRISRSTLMLIAVGHDDQSAGDREGRYIFFQTPQIPTRSKNFVTVMSDYHGTPPLVANHGAPVAPRKGFARAVAQDKVSSGAIMDLIRLKREQGGVLNAGPTASDSHGPSLGATHAAPVVPRQGDARALAQETVSNRAMIDLIRLKRSHVDALNYYGYWKLFDALTDAAFYGTNREYALGNTPQQRFMGVWSDGTPVAELVLSEPAG